jgi:hypothetical protein
LLLGLEVLLALGLTTVELLGVFVVVLVEGWLMVIEGATAVLTIELSPVLIGGLMVGIGLVLPLLGVEVLKLYVLRLALVFVELKLARLLLILLRKVSKEICVFKLVLRKR